MNAYHFGRPSTRVAGIRPFANSICAVDTGISRRQTARSAHEPDRLSSAPFKENFITAIEQKMLHKVSDCAGLWMALDFLPG
jgi:hypothetical protein